jgi:Cu(I)/Ag(I) efflux system protein CusF
MAIKNKQLPPLDNKERIMKLIQQLALSATLAVAAATGAAEPKPRDSAAPSATAAAAMSDGEIIKVDKDAARLTIKHGELKNLAMPGMTMVFRVRSRAMLDQVHASDKVRFVAENVAGALTVTTLEAAN